MDEDGNATSLADTLAKLLRHPSRKNGVTGDAKHKKREQNKKTEDQDYVAVHHAETKSEALIEQSGEIVDKSKAKTYIAMDNKNYATVISRQDQ